MIRAIAGALWAALDWLFPRATGRMDIDMSRLTEDEACDVTQHSNDDHFHLWELDLKAKETDR